MIQQLLQDINIINAYLTNMKVNCSQVYVAGGALRDTLKNKHYKDIDLYFTSKELAENVSKRFSILFSCESDTRYATTVHIPGISVPIQIIKILYGNPVKVISQFDFTINAKYMLLSDGEINRLNNDYSLRMLDEVKTPSTLLHRMLKHMSNGYEIEKDEFIKVLDKMKEVVLKSNKNTFKSKDLIGFYTISPNSNQEVKIYHTDSYKEEDANFTADDIPW